MMKKHVVKISVLFAASVLAIVYCVSRDERATAVKVPEAKSTALVSKGTAAVQQPLIPLPKPAMKPAPVPVAALKSGERLELESHLSGYKDLHRKVMKTDDEKEEYYAAMKNRRGLVLAKKIILHPSRDTAKLQNDAVGMMVEAVKSGDAYALEVAAQIIADPAIEAAEQPMPIRQMQAELKAELLYEWSSRHPNHNAHIEALLPGPASKNLWGNVQAQQANNVAESELTR